MGAEFNYRTYDGTLDKKKVLSLWDGDVNESRYERGVRYSGDIGMLQHNKKVVWDDSVFETEDTANEYIVRNHIKHYPPLAVQYKCGGKLIWMIGGWCAS